MKTLLILAVLAAVVWFLAWMLYEFNPWNEFRHYEEGVWHTAPDGRERRWVWKASGSSPETYHEWKEWEYRGIPAYNPKE